MPVPDDLPKILSRKGGVFVTLKKHGYLRGCIGTYLPTRDSLVEEIIHNAVSAAFQDPRFNPLHKSEFAELDISVDILSTPVKAKKEELNPKIYGVIVSSGYKRGLLLPDLEGVNTASEQLRIACEKAGIPPNSNYEIYKFTVERHGDKLMKTASFGNIISKPKNSLCFMSAFLQNRPDKAGICRVRINYQGRLYAENWKSWLHCFRPD